MKVSIVRFRVSGWLSGFFFSVGSSLMLVVRIRFVDIVFMLCSVLIVIGRWVSLL